MSTQVQYRRGSNVQVAAFTGALGELVIDTTNKVVVVNDGSTVGGFPQVGLTASQTITNKIYNGTSLSVTGNVTAAGATINGDLSVTGNATLSGNILGDRVVNGTTSFEIQTANGNANVSVAGTSNVVVFANTGIFVTGIASVSGNITGGNVSATNLTGTLLTAAQTNITSVGTLGSLAVTANITGGNLLTAGIISATGNITGGNVNTAGLVTATGNITGGNLLTAGIISATGNVTGGNVSATNLTGTLLTAAQTNITSVGILGSLSVTGTATVGNVATAGSVSATGNISGGNLNVTGNIVDTGALGINTGSNGNITLNAGTGFIIASSGILNGQANGVGNIGNSTGYFNTIFAKATSAQYADLAEMYQADTDYAPGTVVEFGGDNEITVSTQSHSTRVAGIISTNPSYLMNATQAGNNVLPVALTGRVPCKVIGKINKGDRLVASDQPGVATALDKNLYEPGCIIGKALQNYNNNTTGTIEVAVGRF